MYDVYFDIVYVVWAWFILHSKLEWARFNKEKSAVSKSLTIKEMFRVGTKFLNCENSCVSWHLLS